MKWLELQYKGFFLERKLLIPNKQNFLRLQKFLCFQRSRVQFLTVFWLTLNLSPCFLLHVLWNSNFLLRFSWDWYYTGRIKSCQTLGCGGWIILNDRWCGTVERNGESTFPYLLEDKARHNRCEFRRNLVILLLFWWIYQEIFSWWQSIKSRDSLVYNLWSHMIFSVNVSTNTVFYSQF